MIVTKKTIDKIENAEDFNKTLDTIKEFSNTDFSNTDAIFKFNIAGRKRLEFCILHQCGGHEVVADLTNKTVQKISDFKWGTAEAFSKSLAKNWDKLSYYDDGSFKI